MRICVNGIMVDAPDEQYAPAPEEQIASLKAQLAETDYKALKYAEGWLSREEYAPIRAARQAIRDQINALEAQAVPADG